jgi:hypothetical protein
MKFKALRPLRGDYGENGLPRTLQPGEVFIVPDSSVKRLLHLESRGIIERCIDRPRLNRAAYRIYEQQAVTVRETQQFSTEPRRKGNA